MLVVVNSHVNGFYNISGYCFTQQTYLLHAIIFYICKDDDNPVCIVPKSSNTRGQLIWSEAPSEPLRKGKSTPNPHCMNERSYHSNHTHTPQYLHLNGISCLLTFLGFKSARCLLCSLDASNVTSFFELQSNTRKKLLYEPVMIALK